jgi:hypothetical protein
MPITMPTTLEMATTENPTISDVRSPYRIVERMPRPWSSVPRGKADRLPSIQAGGSRKLPRSTDHQVIGIHGGHQWRENRAEEKDQQKDAADQGGRVPQIVSNVLGFEYTGHNRTTRT